MVDGVRTHVLHRSRVTGSELFFCFSRRDSLEPPRHKPPPSLLLIFIFSVHMSFFARRQRLQKPAPHFF